MQGGDVHRFALRDSATISGFFIPNLIEPQAVIRTLNAAGVRFMLLGAYAIPGWTQ